MLLNMLSSAAKFDKPGRTIQIGTDLSDVGSPWSLKIPVGASRETSELEIISLREVLSVPTLRSQTALLVKIAPKSNTLAGIGVSLSAPQIIPGRDRFGRRWV